MYLKSLEIHGFKSFPTRTVMTFEPGTTVVVGPNGSGKSNISDAMRWVLGEVSSRTIRGNTMDDVIFGGTDNRRPMGYAEVSVCFDNTDPTDRFDLPYDEVTVTRRYYRGGTSEYLINQKISLRREVHELFMNTGVGREGYSIIGQGKVAEMISKKSEERRIIFEEAAGISKFRHRKHDAELKLDATTKNMETTHVQISMYEEQLGPLEKEAEKARRAEAIKEEKKALDVALWLYDSQKIHEDVSTSRITYETQKEDLDVLSGVVEKLYQERTDLDDERNRRLWRSEDILQNINQVKEQLHQLDARSSVIANEISHTNAMIMQTESRKEDLQKQSIANAEELATYQAQHKQLENEANALSEEKLELVSEQQGTVQRMRELEAELSEALRRLEGIEANTAGLRVRVDVLKNARLSDQNKTQTLQNDIEEYEKTGEKLKQEAIFCEQNAADFKNKIVEQDAIIEEKNKEIASLTEEKNICTADIGALQVSHNTKITRANDLQRMVDQMDGYSRSVKVVMTEYEEGRISGGKIYGPLSNLVTIDRAYVTAIETALGSSAQNIVTDTDRTAKAAIEALKRSEKGRATFLPVNTIRPGNETDEIRSAANLPGYVSRADKLVQCDPEFRPIVEWLLLRTVVFDTLENAVSAANILRHKVRLVTLDGQIMNVGGSMTGGSVKNEGTGVLARNGEIQSLREEAERIAGKIDKRNKQCEEIEEAIVTARNAIADAEQNKELMYTMARTQFAALDSANARLSANESLLEKLREDYNSISGMQNINDAEIEAKERQLEKADEEIASLRAYREEVNIKLGAHQEERDAMSEKIQACGIRAAEIARDIQANETMVDSIRLRGEHLKADMQEQNTRAEQLRQAITGFDEENAANLKQQEQCRSELDELNSARDGLQTDAVAFDKRMTEINNAIKIKENDKNNAIRAFSEIKTKYEQLQEEQERLSVRLHDEYEMSYDDAIAANYPPVTPKNEKEMRQNATACVNKLRFIGGYSPTAIMDYLDIKAKYDEVNGQYVDLKTSLNNLSEIIRKLDEEMANTFLTSFEQINENFSVVFRDLFGGGFARLSLTEPEHVLTSGIEIEVAPPGKNIRSLSLLSGGEQSFVAIALFFSILKLHPTPFCILDEVEAALDDVNVYRFGEYIKRFCTDTQFILITHRRGTMQIADRLYGVTMPERGISKVICVDIAEMESKKNELTDTD